MTTVLTLTVNPAIDLSTDVDHVAPDQKLRRSAPKLEPGGGGINVARAMRQLGTEAMALWTRGGSTGQLFHELLDGEGISHEPIPVRELTRQNVIVRDRSSGQQYRFGMPGPELDRAEAEAVLVSLGAAGALLVDGDRTQFIRSPTVPIRSRVGAGDSMVAVLAWALVRGCDLAESARWGVAAGAAAVMTPGTELCRKDDVERLFAEMTSTAGGRV